jgi:hypothetical protein
VGLALKSHNKTNFLLILNSGFVCETSIRGSAKDGDTDGGTHANVSAKANACATQKEKLGLFFIGLLRTAT